MSTHIFHVDPEQKIPEFLVKEVAAKIAYVDAAIRNVNVAQGGGGIVLDLQEEPNQKKRITSLRKSTSL